jgi:hypothetical protein
MPNSKVPTPVKGGGGRLIKKPTILNEQSAPRSYLKKGASLERMKTR